MQSSELNNVINHHRLQFQNIVNEETDVHFLLGPDGEPHCFGAYTITGQFPGSRGLHTVKIRIHDSDPAGGALGLQISEISICATCGKPGNRASMHICPTCEEWIHNSCGSEVDDEYYCDRHRPSRILRILSSATRFVLSPFIDFEEDD